MLEEGVEMAPVVFLLGREGSASAAWGDSNTTTPPVLLSLVNPVAARSHLNSSSFHSSQWPLSWLGAVSLCLPRLKVRSSPKNSMAGKS